MFNQLYWDLKKRINDVLKYGDNDAMDMMEIDAIMQEIQAAEDEMVDEYAKSVEAKLIEEGVY